MVLGIVGFFVVMATIQTVVLEVRGKPAGVAATTLAILLLIFWLTWRARGRTGV